MSRTSESVTKHRLVIAAIFKDENPYLREWLEYHRHVGIGHFYLYDNDGGELARQILKPYRDRGIVTVHPWTHLDGTRFDGPTPLKQRNKNHVAFGHAVRHYRHLFDWILKIDLDEFIVPLEGDNVPDLLDRYDRNRIRGLRIPRINFGDNGHRTRPDALVTEAYTRREARYSDHKDVGNSRFLDSQIWTNSAHVWGYRLTRRGRVVNEDEISELRVHHYYTKSLEEHLRRQNTSRGRPQSVDGFFAKNEGRNEVEDRTMDRFLPYVRKALDQG